MVSVATTMYHLFHSNNEYNTAILVQSASALLLKPFNPSSNIKRLIIIVLHAQHYFIIEINYDSESVRIYDGFEDEFKLTSYNNIGSVKQLF